MLGQIIETLRNFESFITVKYKNQSEISELNPRNYKLTHTPPWNKGGGRLWIGHVLGFLSVKAE